jgi:hypothetical protein
LVKKKAKPNPACFAPECTCGLAFSHKEKSTLREGMTALTITSKVAMAMALKLKDIQVIEPQFVEAGVHDTKALIGDLLGKAVPALELLHEKYSQLQRGELPTEIDLSPEAIATWKKEHAAFMKAEGGQNPILALLAGMGALPPEAEGVSPQLPVTGLNPPRLRRGDIPDGPLN